MLFESSNIFCVKLTFPLQPTMPKNTHTSASRTTTTAATTNGKRRRPQEHHNKPNVDTSDKNSLELQKKCLNISGGGVFYERAASRRERHRNALMASQDMAGAVPLGQLGRSKNKKKGATAKGPGLAVDMKPVRQDEDDEIVTKQLEMKAQRRLQIISQMRPSLRPNNKQTSSLPTQQVVGSRKETKTRPSHPDRYAGTASTNNDRDLERVQPRKSPFADRGSSQTGAETRKKRRRQT